MVRRSLAPSRSQARLRITEGDVAVNGVTETKPGRLFAEDAHIELTPGEEYASRAGKKLSFALSAFSVDPAGRAALDIGASAGGFTHCLLRRGAARVYAVDVGHGQLHRSLREDARVVSMEGVNARALNPQMFGELFPLAVLDVSFISQALIYPALASCLCEGGQVVALVKPQYEAGPRRVKANDEALFAAVLGRLSQSAAACGLLTAGTIPSPITGADGSREFFLYLRKEK
jgi:23S rRNA (cytidine1920-2'-O)/16S rRNA (cytidine1409-2'-O)-methyltransferase